MTSRAVKEIVEAVVLVLIVFLLIQGSVRNFRVHGNSMQPTLDAGQYLLVNKLVYFNLDLQRLSQIIPFWKVDKPSTHFAIHPPKRGDVIVFRFPLDPSQDYVKRIIGVPGDVIEIRDGTVHIDGVPLGEPYLTAQDKSTLQRTEVGEKEYFVLGDNRRNSNDSRKWGQVPEANVRGKVWVVYWPFSQVQMLDTVNSLTQGLLH